MCLFTRFVKIPEGKKDYERSSNHDVPEITRNLDTAINILVSNGILPPNPTIASMISGTTKIIRNMIIDNTRPPITAGYVVRLRLGK